MTEHIKISIIVPVYNNAPYLSKCIESILAQTLNEFELLLIDNQSTDNSLNICRRYAAQDPRVKVFVEPNKGVSSARNTGLKHASGEFIGFVDSDDYISPEMYQKLYDTARKHNVNICCCNAYYVSATRKEPHNYLDVTQNGLLTLSNKQTNLFKSNFHVWRHIFKRESLKNIRFNTDIHIAEDVLFLLETYLQEQKIYALADYLYFYRLNNASSLTNKINPDNLDILKLKSHLEQILSQYPHIPAISQNQLSSWLCGHFCYWFSLIPKTHRKKYISTAQKQLLPKDKTYLILQTIGTKKKILLFNFLPLLTIIRKKQKQTFLLFGFFPLIKIKN